VNLWRNKDDEPIVSKPVRYIMSGLAILLAWGLTGCIQPVETPAPATATAPVPPAAVAPTATLAPDGVPEEVGEAVPPIEQAEGPPPVEEPIAAPGGQEFVEPFVQGRGHAAADVQVWGDAPLGPDRLLGFAFTGAGGFPCTGFLLVSATANNGAIACATDPAASALASVSYISTSDGQPYTITFGRVLDPAITAVAVLFDDGSSQSVGPSGGGFMVLHPDIFSVVTITAIDALGNTVIDNIPQIPAS